MGESKKELLSGSTYIYISTFLCLSISLLTTIVLSRLLDKELWGIFSSTLAVTSFVSAFYDFGLGYTIVYQTSTLKKNKEKLGKMVWFLFKYKVALTLFFSILIFLLSNQIANFFHNEKIEIYIKISSIYFFLFNLFGFFDNLLIGLKEFFKSSLFNLSQFSFRFIFSVAFVLFGFGVSGAIFGYIISLVILTFAQFLILNKFFVFEKEKISISEVFKYGFFVGIANMAYAIAYWTDSIMIGFFIGTTAVGIYRIAGSAATAVASLLSGINRVAFPILSEEQKILERIENLNKVIKYGSYICIPAMFGLAFLSGGIIRAFFGEQYYEAWEPLSILSYLVFDAVVCGAIVTYFASKGETKLIGKVAVFSAVLNVILNYFLIPVFGLVGAAFASVASRFFAFVYLVRKVKVDFSPVFKAIFGSVAMVVFLFAVSGFFYAFGVAGVIFLAFLGVVFYVAFEEVIGFSAASVVVEIISTVRKKIKLQL